MKAAKLAFIVLAAALLVVGISTMSFAFHSGGVAECEGCHSMHSPTPGGSFLLVGSDQSSACLSCHEHAGDTGPSSYHISTADADLATFTNPLQRTPGGDFAWIKRSFSFLDTDGTTTLTEEGNTHGHDINAADFGYTGGTNNALAPGGAFPQNQLGCSSCHDPHGQYRRLSTAPLVVVKSGEAIKGSGSYNGATNEPSGGYAVGVYRLLAGAGYTKDGVTFNGAPPAKVPSSYNRTESASSTRVAYGAGAVANASGADTWSEWCSTCHPGMHSVTGNYVHPTDRAFGGAKRTIYNTYVKSGDMTGSAATAYTSLVPFASSVADYAALATVSSTGATAGPASDADQVNCMSCHRAHASGWEYALRWMYQYEFMTKDGAYVASDNPAVTGTRAGVQHRGRTIADATAAYYDRPATQFSGYQRMLCNKCHAKD